MTICLCHRGICGLSIRCSWPWSDEGSFGDRSSQLGAGLLRTLEEPAHGGRGRLPLPSASSPCHVPAHMFCPAMPTVHLLPVEEAAAPHFQAYLEALEGKDQDRDVLLQHHLRFLQQHPFIKEKEPATLTHGNHTVTVTGFGLNIHRSCSGSSAGRVRGFWD